MEYSDVFCAKGGTTSVSVRYISRVPNQNGVSQAWYLVEIHHSGRKPSICILHFDILIKEITVICTAFFYQLSAGTEETSNVSVHSKVCCRIGWGCCRLAFRCCGLGCGVCVFLPSVAALHILSVLSSLHFLLFELQQWFLFCCFWPFSDWAVWVCSEILSACTPVNR